MKVVCRGILLVIAFAIVAVMALGVYALAFFNPNDLKSCIVDTVRERTGMTLVMDGSINWRFYPHVGFSIDSVKAYAPDQSIMNGPQASIRHADISFSLSRLLLGDIIVNGLNAQGVRVNLLCDERHRQSCLTWVGGLRDVLSASMPMPPHPFLIEASHTNGEGGASKESSSPMRMDGSTPPPSYSWPRLIFDLDRVKIEDGEVHYMGPKDGLLPRIDINQLTLVGSHVAFGRSFPVSVTFDVASGTRFPPATIMAQANARSDMMIGRHEVDHLRLAALSGDNRYSMSLGQLTADTNRDEYQVTDVRLDGMLRSLIDGGDDSPFSLAFNGHYDGLTDKAILDALSLSLQGVNVTGRVEGLDLFSMPRWKGALDFDTTNLRQWLATNGLKTLPDNAHALRHSSADIDFSIDDHQLTLDSVRGNLDGQIFTASLQWPFDDVPVADIAMPELLLDRYLPLEDGLLPTPSRSASRDMTAPAWVNWLSYHRALAFKVRADVDSLLLHDRALHNVSLALSTKDGRWQLSRLVALLGNGQLTVGGIAQATPIPGKFLLTTTFRDVPIYADHSGIYAPSSVPTLNGRMELSAQLNDPWGTLSGPVTLSLSNDNQTGTWLSHFVCRAAAQASNTPTGEVMPAMLDSFNGRFTLRDGVLYSDDLRGRLSGNVLEGKGVFDLTRRYFDYHLLLKPQTDAVAGCALPRKMVGNGMLLRCSGSLSDVMDNWCGLDDERSSSILRTPLLHLSRRATSP